MGYFTITAHAICKKGNIFQDMGWLFHQVEFP